MNKIIIKVNRGLVESVYSNLEELEIVVLDEDILNDDYEEDRKIIRKDTLKLTEHRLL